MRARPPLQAQHSQAGTHEYCWNPLALLVNRLSRPVCQPARTTCWCYLLTCVVTLPNWRRQQQQQMLLLMAQA